uniref:Uncharacterized protein n=1 Tax=Schistosoma haematobium TaxID=6185 RepID=A0A095A2F2_SCHHA
MLVNEGNIEYGLKKKSDFLEVGTPDGSRRSSTHRCSDVNLNTHRRSAQEDSFMNVKFKLRAKFTQEFRNTGTLIINPYNEKFMESKQI